MFNMKNYNISFCGAHGTGKTTILNEFKNDPICKGFKFFTGLTRKENKKGLKINEEGTFETQERLFQLHFDLFNTKGSYMSDRCIIDTMAYTMYHYTHSSKEDKNKWMEIIQRHGKLFSNNKENLSILCYFPIDFPIVGDGVRSIDKSFQEEIDFNIQCILKESKIPYLRVSGTVEERIKFLKGNIFI